MIRARGGTGLGGGLHVLELPSLAASWGIVRGLSFQLTPAPHPTDSFCCKATLPELPQLQACAHGCPHRTCHSDSGPVIPEYVLPILPPLSPPGISMPPQATPVCGPLPCTLTPRALYQWAHVCQLSSMAWPFPERGQ